MKKVFAMLLLLATSLAQANYTCSGTVSDLVLSPNGVLTASVGSLAWVYLCQMGTTYNGISPDACKALYAHLLTAKATGSQEVFYFNDSLNCTSHPAWADLTGWYFGPDMQ